jgi:hypothetical protein
MNLFARSYVLVVVVAAVQVCVRPYDEQPDVDAKYSSKPPPEMVRPGVCVLSCSS